MGNAIKYMDSKLFNYGLFESDINEYCKAKKTTQKEISTNVLYRSVNYLNNELHGRRLQENVAIGLASLMGQPLKRYEITPPPKPKEEPKKETKPAEPAPAKGWGLNLLCNEEYGVCSVIVTKDGKELTKAHSAIVESNDTGIVKSISYAIHMCYKNLEQRDMASTAKAAEPTEQKIEEPVEVKPEVFEEPEEDYERKSFKDWVRKYSAQQSEFGRLARFIASVYFEFPSWGEVKMKRYLQSSCNSRAHINAFEKAFESYRTWCSEVEAHYRNQPN